MQRLLTFLALILIFLGLFACCKNSKGSDVRVEKTLAQRVLSQCKERCSPYAVKHISINMDRAGDYCTCIVEREIQ